ncbi:septation protein SepH [Corynebacterium sp. 35RC1]|nr:septation protein SepH [Corynebacterium sp. 35RC1]
MRELMLIPEESNRASLVFRTVTSNSASEASAGADGANGTPEGAAGTAGTEEQFFLAVDDTLRHILLHGEQPEAKEAEQAGNKPSDVTTTATDPDSATEPQGDVVSLNSSPAAETSADQPQTKPRAAEPTPAKEMDPRLSAPLAMRPREIQERIRGGASVAELAEENGVTEARIEPYAHPVLLERSRLAEMAKQAKPVREDGPAPLTLWEVLATAFAARGIDLTSTEWDAYRDPSGQWVVRVSWRAGLSENTAEWSYHRSGANQATAVARNGIAADLIDPDFARPVRKLSVHPLIDPQGDAGTLGFGTAESDMERTRDDLMVISDQSTTSLPTSANAESSGTAEPAGTEAKSEAHDSDSQEIAGEDFLVQEVAQPQSEQERGASKRRRRAVTPHWEDVLLGVRANTKRPKN